jgi:hypothetical protein
MDMTVAINKRIEKLQSQTNCSGGKGVLLASIDAPVMMIAIKPEFLEYIRRYGPPEGGKFDQQKLQIVRTELGVSAENTL